MRRSGLICLARSSRTGLDMSHILFMVEILLLTRSEERFSRNAETDLVCRLLLEKKKRQMENSRNVIRTTQWHYTNDTLRAYQRSRFIVDRAVSSTRDNQ